MFPPLPTGQSLPCSSAQTHSANRQQPTAFAQSHIQTGPVTSQQQQPIAAREVDVASHTPLQQPQSSSPSTPAVHQQILRDLRPYLLEELFAQNMYNELWSTEVISYPLYKAIKAAPSDEDANERLIEFIEQAPDSAPWNGLLKTLKSKRLQDDFPVLAEVLENITAAVARQTAASVARQEPVLSQQTAASGPIAQGSGDQQPLAPHQKILRQKWVYLVSEPIAKAMNTLLWARERPIPDDLHERIARSGKESANEMLLEYLYEADSDQPWKDFLQVLGSRRLWRDWPVMEEVHSALVRA